jgi:hypothetical protein
MVGSGFPGVDVVADGGGAVPAGRVGEIAAGTAVTGGGTAGSCANPKSAIEIAANAELLSRIPLRTPRTALRPHRAERQRSAMAQCSPSQHSALIAVPAPCPLRPVKSRKGIV